METARQIAFKALMKIQNNKGFSNLVVNNSLNAQSLSSKDRAFVTALVYGVVERSLTLDFIIEANSSKKIKNIDTPVLTILRMGVYQLYFMRSVTESAAVNESVKLAKKYGHEASAKFVNAILRKIEKNEMDKLLDHISKKALLDDNNERRFAFDIYAIFVFLEVMPIPRYLSFFENNRKRNTIG